MTPLWQAKQKARALEARLAQRAERRAAGIVIPPPSPPSPESYDQVRLKGYVALRRVFPDVPKQKVVAALHGASGAPTLQRPMLAARTLVAQAPVVAVPAPSPRPQLRLLRTATAAPTVSQALTSAPVVARTVTTGGTVTRTLAASPCALSVTEPPAHPDDGPVPGLVAWLRAMELDDLDFAVVAWAEKEGAAHLEELVENVEDLAQFVGDEAGETLRRRAADAAREVQAPPPQQPLVRATSGPPVPLTRLVSLQQPLPPPPTEAVVQATQVQRVLNTVSQQPFCSRCEGFGYNYTRRTVCTCNGYQAVQPARMVQTARAAPAQPACTPLVRAQSSETAWFTPLDRGMSLDQVTHRQKKAQGNARPRYFTPPKHRWRVDPILLKKRIPSPTELSVLDDAKRRAADEHAAWDDAHARKIVKEVAPSGSPLASYENMQDAFLHQHGSTILKELGPEVTLEPAPIASHLQGRIFGAALRANSVPNFGYHGTAVSNYDSIFSQGLRIPGRGGVTVAHGSAHGVGIYTAKGGAPGLSRGFVPQGDSDLLVVGVVDKMKASAAVGPRYVNGHREHHKPAAASSAAPKYINGRKVQSDDGAIRCVGDARVVFDEDRVMPLFVAKGGARRSYCQTRQLAPNSYQAIVSGPLLSGSTLTKDPLQRAGNNQAVVMESGETVWLPPEESKGWNEIRVKRRVVAKERDVHRARQRDTKAAVMAVS